MPAVDNGPPPPETLTVPLDRTVHVGIVHCVDPDELIVPDVDSASRQGCPPPVLALLPVPVYPPLLTTSAVDDPVIMYEAVELKNLDIPAATGLCTETWTMTSEFVTLPEHIIIFAVIWLSVSVPVHALEHDAPQALLQPGDAVPEAPFNCAIRAANVAAACWLAVVLQLPLALQIIPPAIAETSAVRWTDILAASQPPTSTPSDSAATKTGIIRAIQTATEARRPSSNPRNTGSAENRI
jgi:hypothetical protein